MSFPHVIKPLLHRPVFGRIKGCPSRIVYWTGRGAHFTAEHLIFLSLSLSLSLP